MPIYIYEHPTTKEVKEIVQSMTEAHEYSEGEVKWNRIFVNPTAKIDTNIDPFSKEAFVKKTGEMKGLTIGQMWDMSSELSDKRANKRDGTDPVKEQAIKAYEKKTKKSHPLASKKLPSITI
jgi:hypothetical protein